MPRFPGLNVVGAAVWRGSLLVALDVAQTSTPTTKMDAVQGLLEVPAATWLSWLGLPEHMEASVQVGDAMLQRCIAALRKHTA